MRRVIIPLVLLASCVPPVEIPDEERARASRELEGRLEYLQVAAYASQFFGDETKMLLCAEPSSELDLLETPGGEPILPPPPERVLLPGTPLRITRVEFPTGFVIARRMLHTPRYHPWIYLALAGEARPLIVVLPQLVANTEEARAELERLVGPTDPSSEFRALPDAQRAAISHKQLIDGMSPRAVELAWGYPEKRVIDRPSETEAWTWSGGKRTAFFHGGRLALSPP
ncbi:MAG TPA: hypothetical protein VLV17_00460 [Anaeromyxobacteraceae bacterium]|nr:hypothetical protein [Anaeromyxobacteraceae bacterium]